MAGRTVVFFRVSVSYAVPYHTLNEVTIASVTIASAAHRTESEFLEKASAFGVSVERVRLSTFLPPHWLTPDGAALRQHADLPAEADDDGAEGALPEELRSQLRLEVLCLSLTPDGLARELEGTDGAYVRPEVVALPC